jgi:hypothetical protein
MKKLILLKILSFVLIFNGININGADTKEQSEKQPDAARSDWFINFIDKGYSPSESIKTFEDYIEIIKKSLNDPKIDVNYQDDWNKTPLIRLIDPRFVNYTEKPEVMSQRRFEILKTLLNSSKIDLAVPIWGFEPGSKVPEDRPLLNYFIEFANNFGKYKSEAFILLLKKGAKGNDKTPKLLEKQPELKEIYNYSLKLKYRPSEYLSRYRPIKTRIPRKCDFKTKTIENKKNDLSKKG